MAFGSGMWRARGAGRTSSRKHRARLRDVATEPPEPAVPSGPSLAARLFGWLSDNWVYAVAAASLALAGVFFVQYGIENGLLPPAARVAAALLFGLALVAAGETARAAATAMAKKSAPLICRRCSAGRGSCRWPPLLQRVRMYGLIDEGVAFAGSMATAAGVVALPSRVCFWL